MKIPICLTIVFTILVLLAACVPQSLAAPTQEPSLPLSTPTLTSSPMPTATPTPEVAAYTIEGVSCLSKEDCFGGQIEENEAEGKKYYLDILDAWLNSGVNDEYFQNNFGINDPKAAGAAMELLNKLRANNYEMPAGLILAGGGAGSCRALFISMPAFKYDSLLFTIMDSQRFYENQIKLASDDPRRIQTVEKYIIDAEGIFIFGNKIVWDADGVSRLMVIIATSGDSDYVKKRKNSLSAMDPANAASMKIVNKLAEFYPYLYRQLKYAKTTYDGHRYMFIWDYFFQRTESTSANEREGNYNYLDSRQPKYQLFVPVQ